MSKIWKFEIPVSGETCWVPHTGKVLHIEQAHAYALSVWILVNPGMPRVEWKFHVYNAEVSDDAPNAMRKEHIGSVKTADGQVLHVFVEN